jgi:cytochrome c oxidase subunit 3
MSVAEAHAIDHSHDSVVKHQFEDFAQQKEADTMGMWLFLAQEVMFFGGLFGAYTVYRSKYVVWHEASAHLNIYWGLLNTFVLLFSSLTMATAVHYAIVGNKERLVRNLWYTFGLGMVFLGVKVIEYRDKWTHHLIPGIRFATPEGMAESDAGPFQLFYVFYFLMTGMHALHMIIGIAILAIYLVMAKKGMFTKGWFMPVELFGFYWHFVDIVWVYLFPLLYLIDRTTDFGGH